MSEHIGLYGITIAKLWVGNALEELQQLLGSTRLMQRLTHTEWLNVQDGKHTGGHVRVKVLPEQNPPAHSSLQGSQGSDDGIPISRSWPGLPYRLALSALDPYQGSRWQSTGAVRRIRDTSCRQECEGAGRPCISPGGNLRPLFEALRVFHFRRIPVGRVWLSRTMGGLLTLRCGGSGGPWSSEAVVWLVH